MIWQLKVRSWQPNGIMKKNGSLTPSNMYFGSHDKVWWKCEFGHEWKTEVRLRYYKHHGCPVCAKQCRTSFAEQSLLFYVKKYFPDTISGDVSIGMELDIYIPSRQIAIEYDGVFWHAGNKEVGDLRKNNLCRQNNIRLIRVREWGLSHIENCEEIFRTDNDESSLVLTIRDILSHLSIFDCDIDLDADRLAICDNYIMMRRTNNLAILHPDLANEWNYEKNLNLKPNFFTSGSNQKVWWKCELGHEWKTSIVHRVHGRNCPYCSGKKVLFGFNDLMTKNPKLADEWNCEKNGGLTPDAITVGSNRKVWWKCKSGHEWQARIPERMKGVGCPYCKSDKLSKLRRWTKEDYIVRLNDINADVEIIGPYLGSNIKTLHRCKLCSNEWYVTPNMILNQHCVCQKCSSGRLKLGNSVLNIDTGETFPSVSSAAKAYNISHTCLTYALKGIQKTAAGCHWKYVDDVEG